MDEYILAYDLGTAGVKTALFKDTGELESSAYQDYKTYFEHPKWSEQDPEEWWQAVCNSTRKILGETKISPDKIACVSLTGQFPSVVPVDESGNLTRRHAMTYSDTRSERLAKKIVDKLGGYGEFYSIVGQGEAPVIFSYSKIMWIMENEPEIFEKTHKFMQAKDYIILRLAGESVIDFSEAAHAGMFNIKKQEWSDEILEATGIPEEMLPELHKSTDVVGHITEEASRKLFLKVGTPVVVGGGDEVCSAAGAGAVEEGTCYMYLGSAAWVGTVTKELLLDQETRLTCLPHIVSGMYTPFNVFYDAGICYQWIKDTFCGAEVDAAEKEGVDVYKIMDSKANSVQPGAGNLIFHPYLKGMGAPYHNPNDRGAFIGLRLIHKKEHFLRSVLEGIAYRLRTIVEFFEHKVGEVENVRVIGGGAKSRFFLQIISDVIGKDLVCPSLSLESCSLGAAMAGGVGVGIFKDFSEAKNMIKIADTTHPRPEVHKKYNELYSLHGDVYQSLALLNNKIAKLERG